MVAFRLVSKGWAAVASVTPIAARAYTSGSYITVGKGR